MVVERASILSICDYDSKSESDKKSVLQKLQENNLVKLYVTIADTNAKYIIGNLKGRIIPAGTSGDFSTPDKLKNTIRFILPKGVVLTPYIGEEKNPYATWEFEPREKDEGISDEGIVVNSFHQSYLFEQFWENISYILEMARKQFEEKFKGEEVEVLGDDGIAKKVKKYENYHFKTIKPSKQVTFKLQEIKSQNGFSPLTWNDSVIRDFNLLKNSHIVCNVKCFWTKVVPEKQEFLIGVTFNLERSFYTQPEIIVKKRKLKEDSELSSFGNVNKKVLFVDMSETIEE
jgi:hypothetical protein